MPFLLRSKAKAVTTIVAQGSLVTTSYVNSIALGAIQWRWFAFVSDRSCPNPLARVAIVS